MNFYVNKNSYSTLDLPQDAFALIKDVKTKLIIGETPENKPLISIIIPTYRRVNLLKEALYSVLSQRQSSFQWEIIVIENGEDDERSQTEIENLIKNINDKRILLFRNNVNIGSGYNWNRGVQEAHGQWITFLHDDDVLCSDALKNIERIITKKMNLKKPLGYIQARRIYFTKEFSQKKSKKKDKKHYILLTRTGALITGRTRTGMPTCGTTILREAYLKAGGIHYDFGATADAVLGYRIMKDYTILLSDRVLGGYRQGNNESLKICTIKALIDSDDLFAQYRYKQSLFAKLWGFLFGKTIHNLNIKTKIKRAKESGLSEEELTELKDNLTPYDFMKIPYYCCVAIYLGFLFFSSIIRTMDRNSKCYNHKNKSEADGIYGKTKK